MLRSVAAGVVAALALLAVPAGARAAITATNITAPPDGTYRLVTGHDGTHVGEPIHVTGTATGAAAADTVDIVCTGAAWIPNMAMGVAAGSGTFTADIPADLFPSGRCRMRAVPSTVDPALADLTPFTGPVITVDERTTDSTGAGGASPNVLYDYFVSHQQARGYADYESAFRCGLCDMRLSYDGGRNSEFLFYENAYLDPTLDAPYDRSSVRVDGRNAWGAGVATIDVDPGSGWIAARDALAGIPPIDLNVAGAPGADLTIDERQDLAVCRDADPWPPSTTCGALVPSGVRLERQVRQTREGTLVHVTDVLRSTDGRAHAVDLVWGNLFRQTSAATPAFRFPWAGAGYATHVAGDQVAGTTAPVTVLVHGADGRPDGDERFAQGAMVLDTAVGTTRFSHPSMFWTPMQVSVPAGGTATVRQAYVMATTVAEVAQVADRLEDEFVAPSVAIDSPAEGATVTAAAVTLSGRATDNKAVTSLTVAGAPVAVGADGRWSVRTTLRPGANALSAVARDAAGNEARATRTLTYVPPTASSVRDRTAPILSGVRITAARFRVGAKPTAVAAARRTPVGATVKYVLSEPATVTFAVVRPVAGRRVGRSCRKATARLRSRPRCTRLVAAGTLRRRSPAGRSALRFTGRIGRRALPARRYRMLLVATDAAGNRSKTATLAFRVVTR